MNAVRFDFELASCPFTFIPDVTMVSCEGCYEATTNKKALLAESLEQKKNKQEDS